MGPKVSVCNSVGDIREGFHENRLKPHIEKAEYGIGTEEKHLTSEGNEVGGVIAWKYM